MAVVGGTTPPLRTGYERIIPQRTTDMFAYTAKQDGKILEVGDKFVKVRYKDGTEVSVEHGRRFGTVPGVTIPHDLKVNVKTGQSVKAGETIVYNDGYFKIDPLDKKQCTWRAGVMVKLALMESATTFEDACEISEDVAKKCTTSITHERLVKIKFEDNISNVIKVGSVVDAETILCTIEEGVIADNDLFNDQSLEILSAVSNNAPKSKYDGVVEKIEVFYHGDKDEMSGSLKKLTDKSDRERIALAKALGQTPTTGEVDSSVRFDKDPLDLDMAIVKIYITEKLGAGIGD